MGATRLETKVDFALDGVGLDDHVGGTLLASSLVNEVFASFGVSHIVLTNCEPHEALRTVLLLGLVIPTHDLGGSLGGKPALRAIPKEEFGTGAIVTTGWIAVNVHEAFVLRDEEREGLTHLLSVRITNPLDIVNVLGSGGIVVGGLCHTQFLGYNTAVVLRELFPRGVGYLEYSEWALSRAFLVARSSRIPLELSTVQRYNSTTRTKV